MKEQGDPLREAERAREAERMRRRHEISSTVRLVLAGVFLALCMILPFLGGNLQPVLNKISPMHFPVLICGFVCGWQYGLMVGFIAPVLRSVLFGVPAMMPTAAAMAFELAVYGMVTGILSRLLPKRPRFVYITLIVAMILGRVVWGLVSVPLYGVTGEEFTVITFLMGAFVNAIPAILLQLLIIPPVIIALRAAHILK